MKFCPVCQTRYDEEILRFCPQDGTPLVEENPTFAEMPSESEEAEDIGEETWIRPTPTPAEIPAAQPGSNEDDDAEKPVAAQRIVIPTKEEEKEPVRAKVAAPRYEQPPQKSNTALVVLVTMMGTLLVLGFLGGIWYFLSGRNTADSNKNININTNPIFSNSNLDTNFNANNSSENFNFNANTNVNVNTNTNFNTATPTRTPTPTPTSTPQNENTNSNLDIGNTNVISRPTTSPTTTPNSSATPTPTATATPSSPSNVNVGIMNSRAINLVKPAYPPNAKQVNASGPVTVQISVDEEGNVLSAKAVSGNALLRAAAENAARQSRFNPVKINDRAVKASGLLVYNFINQ